MPTHLWNISSVIKYKGRTPATSDHPSRSSFETDKKRIMANITEAPENHKTAKLKVSNLCNFIPRFSFLLLVLHRLSSETITDVP